MYWLKGSDLAIAKAITEAGFININRAGFRKPFHHTSIGNWAIYWTATCDQIWLECKEALFYKNHQFGIMECACQIEKLKSIIISSENAYNLQQEKSVSQQSIF